MTAVRPPFPGSAQPLPNAQRQDAGRTAAQRAFLQAALQSQAPARSPQAASQPAPAVSAQPVQRVPTALPDEPPQKILRPGSLLDIRV